MRLSEITHRLPLETLLLEAFAATNSPAFQAWFKGSKVTDSNGDPLLCYHGTLGGFSGPYYPLTHFGTLDAAQGRMATGFTKELISPAVKWGYSGRTRKRAVYRHNPTGFHPEANIRPVYLRITKPYVYQDTSGEDAIYDILNSMKRKGTLSPRRYEDIHDLEDEDQMTKAVITLLSRSGYDGFRYKNRGEDPGANSWAIFRPDQVWSAFDADQSGEV